jgi:peptide/nickel transport system substrate-binding protein
MKKEPFIFYLVRLLLSAGLFVLMLMIYWSSLLVEGDLKSVNSDLTQIKKELSALKFAKPSRASESFKIEPSAQQAKSRPHIDPSLPNLLTEDPFYAKTLPELLGPDFKPHGTRHMDTVGKPDNLHPFTNWVEVNNWMDLCSASVAAMLFGKYETLAPDMAIKMEERMIKGTEIPEYWIHLRDDIFWSPLSPSHFPEGLTLAPVFLTSHPVTAHDFKFYLDAIMNPFVQESGAAALRNYFGDIEEIEVIDDLTFVVRWKTVDVKEADGKVVPKIKYIAKSWTGGLKPLASFVYKYFSDGKKIVEDDAKPGTYRTNSVWGQNFSRHWAKNIIVSCGPWLFDGMTDRQIKFKRNPDFYQPLAALTERIEVSFKNGPDNIWQDFKEGKTDTYTIQPNQLSEVEQFLKSDNYKAQAASGMGVKRLEYLARTYAYIGWNEARPYFKESRVRQALTLAIDRQRIINQNLNGLGEIIHGTFFVNSAENDSTITPWPFDPDQARRILHEEGWYDRQGTGVISKEIDGQIVPFSFVLTYYVKSPTNKSICEYVSTALKEVGIDCRLNGVDTADLSLIFEDKNFDALTMAWGLGTPPDEPRQLWYSSGAKEKGSSNMIGFVNKEIDSIIDQLQFTYSRDKRLELYHQFDRILHAEEPYTFLYTPKAIMLYREYLQNVFIPAKRQDLIPGADVEQPQPNIFWIKGAEP